MYDTFRCIFLSGSLTLLANVPEMFELPLEKIGVGAMLFLVIWTYLRHILPKTQEDIEAKNKRIEELIREVQRFSDQRDKDQKTISELVREFRRIGTVSVEREEPEENKTEDKS
ncbi:MAG: hypothetical protein Q4G59_07880 [Planctomycetia bacterium]|nr:hypothetical protein [Planctomycetia bacterium]